MQVKRAKKIAAACALLASAAAVPLTSLWAEEGLRTTLRVSPQIEHVTETGVFPPDKAGTRGITRLDFGLTSETRNQTFALGLSTGLVYNLTRSRGLETEDSTARLSYSVENRNSLLGLNGSYRQSTIDNADFFDQAIVGDIVTGNGRRKTLSFSPRLILGRESPVSFELSPAYTRTRYSGTIGPNVSDTTRRRVEAKTVFRINPVLDAILRGQWSQFESDSVTGTDRTEKFLGIGATYDVSALWSVNAGLSYNSATSTNPGLATNSENSGLGFTFGARRFMTNGELIANFSSSETINGNRTEALVTRSLDLKRGTASLSLGAVRTDNSDLQPLVNLNIAYELSKTSQFTIGLEQSTATSDRNAETVRTRLNANYTAEINNRSSLGAALQLASQSALSTVGTDQLTATGSLTYRRDVGSDWDLVSGYSRSYRKSEGATPRKTGTLFVGLEKFFDVTP